MLRAPFDQTTTEGTAWSSTMEEPSPIRSLSSQPLALPAPQCQDAHAPALLSRTITRKLKIIIIIATLNHCPKWSNQPLLLHMRTKELMRQMGSPSSSQIQPGGILPEKSSRSSKTLSHGFRVAGAHHTSCVFPHSAPAFTCLVIPTGVVCM